MTSPPRKYVVIAAFTCFLLVNVVCAFFRPAQSQQDESIWFREDRLTIEDFKKNVKDPDIIIMGSSMIRMPMWCVDRDTNVTSAEYVNYHKAEQFEKKMNEAGTVRRAYDLAADGAYASDLLLMFDKLLIDSKRPKLVVCTISPREFVGAWFVSARQTPIYKLLANPQDFLRTGALYSSDGQDWTEGLFRSIVPLYRDADSYKACLTNELKPVGVPASEDEPIMMAGVDVKAASSKSMQTKQKIYENQKQCINELVKIAKQRQVRLVFVNLPLREDAKGIYTPIAADYRKFLNTLGQSVPVLDLEFDPELSQKEFFIDPWHLNKKGGERLIKQLVGWLHANQQ